VKVVLLTGANGFIGAHIKDHLSEKGYTVISVDRNLENKVSHDSIGISALLNGQLKYNEIEAFIHLAARVHQINTKGNDYESFYNDNCILTQKIADWCNSNKVKHFIFASSVKVMGDSATQKKYNENDAPNPDDPYGRSKLEAEKIIEYTLANNAFIQTDIIRFPMVYGPDNKGNMLTLLRLAQKKIPLPLAEHSKKRSMLYVGNICDSVMIILKRHEPAGVKKWFLTDGDDKSSGELYSEIYQQMNGRIGIYAFSLKIVPILFWFFGKKGKLIYNRLFCQYVFSSDAFRNYYNWSPPFSFKDGIGKTVLWYQKNSIS
jgi:nucleoside-diphosphate-sugar epimerase